MATTFDYDWNQGSDLTLSLIYKEGPEGAAVPINLVTGGKAPYKFRMDVVAPDGRTLTVLNDQAIADADLYTDGAQADNTYEVTLGTAGQIVVTLKRSLTLPGGAFYPYVNANPGAKTFTYDMFLRDNTDKQTKILGGTITILKSVTHWA